MFVRLTEPKVKPMVRLKACDMGWARLEKRVSVGPWQRVSCRRYRAYHGASPGIAPLAGY